VVHSDVIVNISLAHAAQLMLQWQFGSFCKPRLFSSEKFGKP